MAKKVFFHVGLQRTGSTFLQRNVFPALKDIEYIPKRDYSNVFKRIKASKNEIILVSREYNKSFEKGILDFADQAEHTVYPIIVLRKQEEWLISQYKRHVKNGFNRPIAAFFPLDGSKGYLNADALDFYEKIELLKIQFKTEPIILLYKELESDANAFIQRLAAEMEVEIDWNRVSLKRVHTSYSTHQLKFIYWTYQKLAKGALRKTKVYRYVMLYLAKLIPPLFLKEIELFPVEYKHHIITKYQQDWQRCIEYIENQS